MGSLQKCELVALLRHTFELEPNLPLGRQSALVGWGDGDGEIFKGATKPPPGWKVVIALVNTS